METVDRWLFREFKTSRKDLAAYRIIYSVLALALFLGRGMWTIGLPVDFWSPPTGVARVLNGQPSAAILIGLNAALTISLLALLLGVFTPVASILSTVLMVLVNSITYSYGKIDHDIVMVLVPALLAFSGWGAVWSLDARRGVISTVERWPLALLAICVGLGMMTAGIAKLSWLELATQQSYLWAIEYKQTAGWQGIATAPAIDYLPKPVWEISDWATVVLECGFVLSCVNRYLFRTTCIVACFFHLGVLLTLDLAHPFNLLAYAAFFPLTRAARSATWLMPVCVGVTALICPWHGWQEFVGQCVVVGSPMFFVAALLRK